jgi:hypothetical protein
VLMRSGGSKKNPNIFLLGSQGAVKAETKSQTVLTSLDQGG